MSCTYYIEPEKTGLDRRVFRELGCKIDWAHYAEWEVSPARARWYGSQLTEVPKACFKSSWPVPALTPPSDIAPRANP